MTLGSMHACIHPSTPPINTQTRCFQSGVSHSVLIVAFVANVNLLLFHPATWLLASEFIFIITFYYFSPALIPTLPLASRYIKRRGTYQSGLPTYSIFSNRVFQSVKEPVSPSSLLPPLVLTMSECHLGSLCSQQIQDDSQGLIFFSCVTFKTVT